MILKNVIEYFRSKNLINQEIIFLSITKLIYDFSIGLEESSKELFVDFIKYYYCMEA